MRTDASVTQMGLDIHRKFSKVTARDGQGKVIWRQRLEHADRPRMREQLARWPNGTAVTDCAISRSTSPVPSARLLKIPPPSRVDRNTTPCPSAVHTGEFSTAGSKVSRVGVRRSMS